MGRSVGTTTKTTTTKASNGVSSVAKQQFEVLQNAIKALAMLNDLPTLTETIKAGVEEIKENFAYQLQEKEIEHNDKKKSLDDSLVEYSNSVQEKKAQLDAELDAKRTEQTRALEQLDYEYKTHVRDKRYDIATLIAKEQSKVLVDKVQFDELQMTKRLNEQELMETATKTEQVVTEKLTNEYESRIKDISAANSLEQVRLRKDLEAANKEINALKADKEVLAKRIEDQTAAIIRISDNATRPNTIVNEAVRK